MLKSIKIVNFQAHKRLEVDFDPHVTCLVGPTDAGKTAAVRALLWLVTNQPQGDAFLRWGSSHCKVEVFIDDHVIVRKRGVGNTYTLDGKVLKSFGQSVPDPVAEILKLEENNFQLQLDAPFWFLKSAPEVSRALNKIVNLEVIDQSLAKVSALVRRTTHEKESCTKRLKEARTTRDSLKWAKDADKELKRLEEAEARLNAMKESEDTLRYLIADAERLKDRVRKVKKPDYTKLDLLEEKHLKLQMSAGILRMMIDSVEKREKELCRKRKAIEKLESGLSRKSGGRCPLCGRKLAKSSPSASRTSTSRTTRPSPGRERRTGTRQ